jgi:hypothetical protein
MALIIGHTINTNNAWCLRYETTSPLTVHHALTYLIDKVPMISGVALIDEY